MEGIRHACKAAYRETSDTQRKRVCNLQNWSKGICKCIQSRTIAIFCKMIYTEIDAMHAKICGVSEKPGGPMNTFYWWSCYDHFTPGEGVLPHMGEVIAEYRQ